ncbi:DUF4864 domain-containing protein [Ramlibacter rhizophilus]|uniref:DUF4864 domain-containing protein n=1 Tax=Ramlibacter rhizophilus TaxID=1781167 RepID=A0A4Z0BEX9_9BURK|nr:DUF4864 domain-containing protein [Ramlibacter rhizophilus]TFY96939.1 DUF4864 domain-containing protein [Ramlibacter rhizophilus]
MTQVLTRILLPVAMAAAAMTSSAAATETASAPAHPQRTHATAQGALLSSREADEVRNVILAQIQAMAENDAERMFETTTPEVRAAIGSSGRFLAMMHGAYPMVYQPSAVNFHPPHRKSDGAFQLVEIKDRNDQSWLAVFIVEQQPDHSWRVSGCAVTENPWLPA